MPWQWPILAVSALFVIAILWRVRPVLPLSRKSSRDALLAIKKRVDTATSDVERAAALCEAGELSARSGRATSAEGYFLRAMRAQPHSAAMVERASAALVRAPRALETLLWHRLGSEPWTAPNRAATAQALTELVRIYEGPRRKRTQARALEFARDALTEMAEHSKRAAQLPAALPLALPDADASPERQ
jgi:hypothetical protein